MSDFDRAHLESMGFKGFEPLTSLPAGCSPVPGEPGAYGVVRPATSPARFLTRSVGGRFKAKDSTVPRTRLRAKWIDGVETMYLGKSGNLRRRLDEFARFGRGEAIGHYGGRYIWQLSDNASLLVCWLVDDEPESREAQLIRGRRAHGPSSFGERRSAVQLRGDRSSEERGD